MRMSPHKLDDHRLQQYLARLGFDQPPARDEHGLRALHRAHLRSVPFENLDIHLGRPIQLDHDHLMAKLLDRNRGGYCYELNGAFASLLTTLGFDVDLLEAQVFGENAFGMRFDHACLRVKLDVPWLADVGFGASFEYPILFQTDIEQHDPAGVFRVVERSGGSFDIDENRTPLYRLSITPRALDEFAEANLFQQSSRKSHFTHNTICSLATERGRVTVRGLRLIETVNDERNETELAPEQLGPVLADRFGIVLGNEDLDRLARKD